MKLCTKCDVEKEEIQFYKNSFTKDNLDNICKTCRGFINNYRKFNSMKKSAKGFDMELITSIAEELDLPFEKVKEIIVSQSKATKHAMNGGFSIKWPYVGKFHTKVNRFLTEDNKNKKT